LRDALERVPEGRHKLRYEFEPTGGPDIAKGLSAPGRGQLYIDGKLVGRGDLPKTIAICVGQGGGVTAGADPGSPVTTLYKPPFGFTGKLYYAVVNVSGDLIKDDEATMRVARARQ
jgi:arylsulfatase